LQAVCFFLKKGFKRTTIEAPFEIQFSRRDGPGHPEYHAEEVPLEREISLFSENPSPERYGV